MITSIVVFPIAVLLKAQWIFLAGFFMAPLYPLSMSYGAQLFQRKLALMTSMAVSLSSVAVVVMHSLMGWVGDHYGVAASLWVGIVFGILSLCALWILPHTDSDNKAKITNSENTVAAGAGAAT
jgi:fucose permease